MSKYRILEKKGTYESHSDIEVHHVDGCRCSLEYIPRFIVQKEIDHYSGISVHFTYEDLKEFTSLAEAHQFKRDLELVDGIVVG
jgi:hypothetical protein